MSLSICDILKTKHGVLGLIKDRHVYHFVLKRLDKILSNDIMRMAGWDLTTGTKKWVVSTTGSHTVLVSWKG